MERVQFQQEQMLDELKDLVEKNLFTDKEAKQIMKKRTAYEAALVRRVAKKADYLRYATYEMGLEQLRRKRVERMKLPPAPATVSDYALVRRQFHIFERAVKKFKSDIGLWVQYIQVAKREGARALVGRITARALQLHPNNPALYILAAAHELDHHSPSAARTLLQRGIRINPDSMDMWKEYVKMELGFIESLRRRWDVLGIKVSDGDNNKDPSQAIMGRRIGAEEDESASVDAEYDGDDGADARRQVMEGAIVESVVSNAVQAIPRLEVFKLLREVIVNYPSPETLRTKLLDHLYEELRRTLPKDAKAVVFVASRTLVPGLVGKELVEGLKTTNEEILERLKTDGREALFEAYATFVEEWCSSTVDINLKHYLIATLEGVIKREKASASLLSAHINTLGMVETSPAKVLKLGQKYTARMPKSARVWLARLEAVKKYGEGEEDTAAVWASGRRTGEGSEEELCALWTWGVGWCGGLEQHERLLDESAGAAAVHEVLLDRYVSVVVTSDHAQPASANWVHMDRRWNASARVWERLFREMERNGDEPVLRAVYECWRQKDPAAARARWGQWLLERGKVVEGGEHAVAGTSHVQ